MDAAVKLVLAGDVQLLPEGRAKVASQSHGVTTYRIVNGVCDCKDFAQAPSHWWKHRIAAGIAKRAEARMQQLEAGDHMPASAPLATHGIDPRHIVMIQGKPFVKCAGLLELAHTRGLQELRVTWTFNDAQLSLAQAVAILSLWHVY